MSQPKLSDLSCYRQQRRDGGVRTGVEARGDTVFHQFEGEAEDANPVLDWWVDVRCFGRKLPQDPEEVRSWLLGHGPMIQQGLRALAGEIRSGIDFDGWPVLHALPPAERGVKVVIACSASRRTPALRIAETLTDFADHWNEMLKPVMQDFLIDSLEK